MPQPLWLWPHACKAAANTLWRVRWWGAAEKQGLSGLTAQDLQAVPGKGVLAKVDGKQLLLGSLRWLQEEGLDIGIWQSDIHAMQAQGASLSALG